MIILGNSRRLRNTHFEMQFYSHSHFRVFCLSHHLSEYHFGLNLRSFIGSSLEGLYYPRFACHKPAITYQRETQKLMLYNFRNKLSSIIFKMTRRSRSPSPTLEVTSPRLAKRPRLDFTPLTPEDYKDGVMLAPMVRSGACAFLIPPTSY